MISEAAVQRRKVRVLVFPCGSEPASEIHQALRYSLHVELIGASSVDDHGRYRYADYHFVPRIDDPGFDEAFAALISSARVDLVFATHDSVIDYLAQRASRWNAVVVNGTAETTRVARRKSATYALFADCSWCPQSYESMEAASWPAVVKPDAGQGGQGVVLVAGPDEARLAMASIVEPLLVEYLPGVELTVDCFTDRHRTLLWTGPRTRERVRAGISMRSDLLQPDPMLQQIADEINQRVVFRGPWFFQVKQDRQGRWKLLEICCRVAGNMAAQRARGINLPLMAVQDHLGRDLLTLPELRVGQVDRSIATRAGLDHQFSTVYVDLDDTLIIDGHVVPIVVHYLYQCRAEGKRIVLITRHEHDCIETLDSACLSLRLFDEIVHITDGTPKGSRMSRDAIFIDNHFPERLAVSRELGIPVFDVDTLEFFVR